MNCLEDLSVFLNTESTIPFKKIMTEAERLHGQLKATIFSGASGHYLPICSQSAEDGSSIASVSSYKSFTRYPDHFVSFQNRLREKAVNQEEEI